MKKRIGRLIDKLQEVLLPDERPVTSTKGVIVVNFPGNTEVIVVDGDEKGACGRPVRKSANTTHNGADASD